MTFKFMRPVLAIALALTLGACGGTASFTVGGTISGLQYPGLVLNTNGMDLPVEANKTSFAFPNSLSYGEVYEVTAKTQPAHQFCTIGAFTDATGHILGNAKDTAGRLTSINVGVMCTVNTFALGGSIKRQAADGTVLATEALALDGLRLTNGSAGGTFDALAASTDFALPAVPYGQSYGVTVLAQPTSGATCSVSPNGTGVMGDAAVADIVVTCVAK